MQVSRSTVTPTFIIIITSEMFWRSLHVVSCICCRPIKPALQIIHIYGMRTTILACVTSSAPRNSASKASISTLVICLVSWTMLICTHTLWLCDKHSKPTLITQSRFVSHYWKGNFFDFSNHLDNEYNEKRENNFDCDCHLKNTSWPPRSSRHMRPTSIAIV